MTSSKDYDRLMALVRGVRMRWKLQAFVRSLAFFLVAVTLFLVLGVWGASLFGFRTLVLWTVRAVTGVAVLGVGYWQLWRPLRKKISEVQAAQFIEERYPRLEDRLVSAVEFGRKPSAGITDLLVRDALEKSARLDFSVFVDWRRLALFAAAAAACVALLAGLLGFGPSFFRYGFERLYMPWAEAAGQAEVRIEVQPGDAETARGSDVLVRARLIGFDAPDVRLHVQAGSERPWAQIPMETEARGSDYLYLMANLEAPLRYFVEARGVRSATHQIRVLDIPRMEKIDLHYTFPAYTGMEPQTVEGEGDISAMAGTRVAVRIRTSSAARRARLLVDGQPQSMTSESGRDHQAVLTLAKPGSYVVQLQDAGGREYAASREYNIEIIPDAPPQVTILKPMKDTRATNVEEVFTEARAEDDIGVSRMEMRYSVNGGAEQGIPLHGGKAPVKSMVGAHTFFLEEMKLQPGDIVSYYARAFDNNTATGPSASASDIYFVQVRTFDQKYTQSQEAGGMPGGGGGDGPEQLSRQQKEIISGTFKLNRDKKIMDAREYEDGMKALALVQSRVQAQAEGLVARLRRRGAVDVGEQFKKFAEYLTGAAEAMGRATVQLNALRPADALPEEQKALQQLLRGESLAKEIQISFGSQMGGGGGGGSQATAEELADLFELELNKLKNQYETVQQGEQQARDRKVDDALERVKELARRQLQINERRRQMASQSGGGGQGGSSGNQGQRDLMEAAEQLRRQLQRLSRERPSPQLEQASRQLEKAIEEMKRTLAQGGRGGDRENEANGARALQQLQDAMRALESGQQAGLEQTLERAAQESRRLAEEQAKVQESVSRMAEQKQNSAAQEFQEQRGELMGRKSELAERVRGLQKNLDALAGSLRQGDRESRSRVGEASSVIRDRRLPERIEGGNQLLEGGQYDYLKRREAEIRQGLEDVARQVESARSALGQNPERRLEQAAGRARQLAEGLESMQDRLNARNPRRGQANANQRGERSSSRQQGSEASDQASGGRASQQQGSEGSREASGGRSSQGEGGPERADSGGRLGPDSRGGTRNAVGPPTGTGPHRDEDARQMQRETGQRLADAEELRRWLDRNPSDLRNLERVIQSLRALDAAGGEPDANQIAALKRAVELMRQIEEGLARELDRIAQRDRYLYAEDNDAPPAYRRLVEEYYRAIAREKR